MEVFQPTDCHYLVLFFLFAEAFFFRSLVTPECFFWSKIGGSFSDDSEWGYILLIAAPTPALSSSSRSRERERGERDDDVVCLLMSCFLCAFFNGE